jgi:K+/H+ antiporter YhaU regulatory subunit KhtT
MLAVGSLLLIATVSLLVTRVATVILTATGVPRHVARFQARSALTGSGFTTSESEGVVSHPIRRRVIATLMLLGNVGIVGAASSAIIGFHGAHRAGWRVLELGAGLLALVLISRSRRVDRAMTAAIGRALQRYTDVPNRDLSGLLQLSGDYAVQELAVNPGDWLADRRLGELRLREEGVVVLVITRPNGTYLPAPDGQTMIGAGDNLVVYGRSERLRELDQRRAGADGGRAHDSAVAEQRAMQQQQDRLDHRTPSSSE